MRSWSRSQLTNTQFLISLSLLKKSNSENDIFVSYDVSALFISVPLEETIHILADKAVAQNWFNETHQLNITQDDLVESLRAATNHQLFQFNGHLYEQIDGVAMGSPLGPLMASVFMCSI